MEGYLLSETIISRPINRKKGPTKMEKAFRKVGFRFESYVIVAEPKLWLDSGVCGEINK